VLCQTPTQSSSEIGRLMTYDRLFIRVMWLEDKASELEAQRKNPAHFRSIIRSEFGLTVGEMALVTAIAADLRAEHDAIRKQAQPLLAAGQSSTSSPDLRSLLASRLKATADHIDALQAVLGPMRFAAMDALVMRPPSTAASPPSRPGQ
jgi:hypothetical protein